KRRPRRCGGSVRRRQRFRVDVRRHARNGVRPRPVFRKKGGNGMRLLFKQRFFSWLDSYDVFDESGAAVFRVKGEISFGHKLRIYDAAGQEAGLVKQKVFCWLPQFELYAGRQYIGRIRKKWSFLRPKYLFD